MRNLKYKGIPHIQAKCCGDVLKRSRSNFLTAFLFIPKRQRQALRKIYTFFRIIDDCTDEPLDPETKKQSLHFWKMEVVKALRNESCHPVAEELKPVINRYRIPPEYFLGLIDGCHMDIVKTRYQNFSELSDYCHKVAGLVGFTCLRIFEYTSPTAEKMAADLGLAFQLTNIIRDLKADLGLGRIYLPLDDMKKFDCTENDLMAGKESDQFRRLMNHFAQMALHHYRLAFEEFKRDRQNKLIAAKIMAGFYLNILKKIIRKEFPVLQQRVSLNPVEKMRVCTLILCRRFDLLLSL